jgi:hypothetical protein
VNLARHSGSFDARRQGKAGLQDDVDLAGVSVSWDATIAPVPTPLGPRRPPDRRYRRLSTTQNTDVPSI